MEREAVTNHLIASFTKFTQRRRSEMTKTKQIGWKHYGDDLYTASLILSEKPTKITIDIIIEPLKTWKPVERVSEKVVRRRQVR